MSLFLGSRNTTSLGITPEEEEELRQTLLEMTSASTSEPFVSFPPPSGTIDTFRLQEDLKLRANENGRPEVFWDGDTYPLPAEIIVTNWNLPADYTVSNYADWEPSIPMPPVASTMSDEATYSQGGLDGIHDRMSRRKDGDMTVPNTPAPATPIKQTRLSSAGSVQLSPLLTHCTTLRREPTPTRTSSLLTNTPAKDRQNVVPSKLCYLFSDSEDSDDDTDTDMFVQPATRSKMTHTLLSSSVPSHSVLSQNTIAQSTIASPDGPGRNVDLPKLSLTSSQAVEEYPKYNNNDKETGSFFSSSDQSLDHSGDPVLSAQVTGRAEEDCLSMASAPVLSDPVNQNQYQGEINFELVSHQLSANKELPQVQVGLSTVPTRSKGKMGFNPDSLPLSFQASRAAAPRAAQLENGFLPRNLRTYNSLPAATKKSHSPFIRDLNAIESGSQEGLSGCFIPDSIGMHLPHPNSKVKPKRTPKAPITSHSRKRHVSKGATASRKRVGSSSTMRFDLANTEDVIETPLNSLAVDSADDTSSTLPYGSEPHELFDHHEKQGRVTKYLTWNEAEMKTKDDKADVLNFTSRERDRVSQNYESHPQSGLHLLADVIGMTNKPQEQQLSPNIIQVPLDACMEQDEDLSSKDTVAQGEDRDEGVQLSPAKVFRSRMTRSATATTYNQKRAQRGSLSGPQRDRVDDTSLIGSPSNIPTGKSHSTSSRGSQSTRSRRFKTNVAKQLRAEDEKPVLQGINETKPAAKRSKTVQVPPSSTGNTANRLTVVPQPPAEARRKHVNADGYLLRDAAVKAGALFQPSLSKRKRFNATASFDSEMYAPSGSSSSKRAKTSDQPAGGKENVHKYTPEEDQLIRKAVEAYRAVDSMRRSTRCPLQLLGEVQQALVKAGFHTRTLAALKFRITRGDIRASIENDADAAEVESATIDADDEEDAEMLLE
ncbi:hypothetical protein IAT40_004821 [Kwoniella sp. CBS 6097]